MIRPSPPIPDGSQRDAQFDRWVRDEILSWSKMQEVPGALVQRTTRGVAVIPKREETKTVKTTTGPLDQAIFVTRPIPPDSPPGTKAKTFIYGVRGGYVGQFDTGGNRLKWKRFIVPCWGDSSICYDDVNDKILCTFWNEMRADDVGNNDDSNAKSVYKLNADTLEVEAQQKLLQPPGTLGLNTGTFDGPHRMLFRDGKAYIMCLGSPAIGLIGKMFLIELDPAALSVSRYVGAFGFVFFQESPWIDLAIDETTGVIWQSSPGDQLVASYDFATFSLQSSVASGGTITSSPGSGLLGSIFPDPDGAQHNVSGGPFPPGYYLVRYKSGVLHFTDHGADRYFVAWQSISPTLVNIGWNTASGHGLVYDNFTDAKNDALNFGLSSFDFFPPPWTSSEIGVISHGYGQFKYSSSDSYTAGQTVFFKTPRETTYGRIWQALINTTGMDPADAWKSSTAYAPGDLVVRSSNEYRAVNASTNDDPAIGSGNWTNLGLAPWQALYDLVEPFEFSVTQVSTYNPATSPLFNAYGVAWATNPGRLIITTRKQTLLSLNPTTGGIVYIDLGEDDWSSSTAYGTGAAVFFAGNYYRAIKSNTNKQPDANPDAWASLGTKSEAFPYCCRYDEISGLLYVAGYKSNVVYVVDPISSSVVKRFGGFDSPFDIVFTRRQDPAHPDDPSQQLSSAFAIQHGDEPLKAIPDI